MTEIKIECCVVKPIIDRSVLNICPFCFGTGKLKAMQMAMTYDGRSTRCRDTYATCEHCKGTGFYLHVR